MFARAADEYLRRVGVEHEFVERHGGMLGALRALDRSKTREAKSTKRERAKLIRFEAVDPWATRWGVGFFVFRFFSDEDWDEFERDAFVLLGRMPRSLEACADLARVRGDLTPSKHREACARFLLRDRLSATFEELARFFLVHNLAFEPDFFGKHVVRQGDNAAALAGTVRAVLAVRAWANAAP